MCVCVWSVIIVVIVIRYCVLVVSALWGSMDCRDPGASVHEDFPDRITCLGNFKTTAWIYIPSPAYMYTPCGMNLLYMKPVSQHLIYNYMVLN